MTAIHDYDADQTVREEQVNTRAWTLRNNATGTDETGVIAWYATAIRCHETQDGWPADGVPQVWDTTGAGTIELASHVQCGGCGTLIYPYARVLEGDAGDEQIREAADSLAAEVAEARDSAAASVRARLAGELRDALEYGQRDDYPPLDGMAGPGVGLSAAGLVAWDYDPRDGDSILEVSEADLAGPVA